MKAKELVFHRVEGHPPQFTCNYCGLIAPAYDWLIAEIPIGDGDTVSLVVCSRRCQRAFQSHPASNRYISDLMRRVAAMRSRG